MQNSSNQISITKEDLKTSSFYNEISEMGCYLKLNENISIFAFRLNGKVSFANGIWDISDIDVERKTLNIVMSLPDDAMLSFGTSRGHYGLEDISPNP